MLALKKQFIIVNQSIFEREKERERETRNLSFFFITSINSFRIIQIRQKKKKTLIQNEKFSLKNYQRINDRKFDQTKSESKMKKKQPPTLAKPFIS